MQTQEVDLAVITTATGRFVVLGERIVEGRECFAVVNEADFEAGMDTLTAGEEAKPGTDAPSFRWVEKRGVELIPLSAEMAQLATRQVAKELTAFLEADL
jgi:hypothetical protein